jgi:hypothetical protein
LSQSVHPLLNHAFRCGFFKGLKNRINRLQKLIALLIITVRTWPFMDILENSPTLLDDIGFWGNLSRRLIAIDCSLVINRGDNFDHYFSPCHDVITIGLVMPTSQMEAA